MRAFLLVLIVLALPAGLFAKRNTDSAADPVGESIAAMYAPVKRNIVAAAEQMPEEMYGFQPTPEVRSFDRLIGHIAFAQYTICAGLRGEANPRPGNIEETVTGKEGLVQAIRDAFAYCDQAYTTVGVVDLADPIDFFGSPATRHYALMYSLIHANEHYGNIVTYMRLNGLVPPSSQPAGG